jgi:hypothetical protein
MDVAEPGRGLAKGLTLPILRVLAQRSSPVSAAQLARLTGQGTEAGVRRAVERLVEHGLCLREEIAGRSTYTLNHDHVLHDAMTALLRADGEVFRRLRLSLAEWAPAPVAAAVFGSAARADGDLDSDIDLLLVRPVLRNDRDREMWARQVHDLRRDVARWTGNRLQVLDRPRSVMRRLVRSEEDLFGNVREDAVWVYGSATDLFGKAA